MEKGNFYRTRDPDEALVCFVLFSVVMMVQYLYVPGAHEYHAIGHTVANYVDVVSQQHPFWNRSLGSDYFMFSCHDWAFSVSVAVKDIPNLKTTLMGISQNQYLRLHRRVKQVQRHFVINGTSKRVYNWIVKAGPVGLLGLDWA
ncbi:hypothetical protein RHMOL_Rhmol06G0250700 [Rhododendron molle]|uniref:Uncharacterized protein n=1 Tax=Rhododendron molle TaxID=49168 RepID=A0ACC0NHF9_RHOML|nr:hypothetical protein RHMOL_Rhmol06G0250700 [Rhododendron molle]